MQRAIALVVLLGLMPGTAAARDLSALRPLPRPVDLAASPLLLPPPPTGLRPLPRPADLVAAAPLLAQPTGPRPLPRPADLATYGLGQIAAADTSLPPPPGGLRPLPRPVDLLPPLQTAVTTPPDLTGPAAPPPRPDFSALADAAPAAEPPATPKKGGLFGGLFSGPATTPTAKSAKSGYVCGDPDIKGVELAPIQSPVKGCGVPEPVRVTSVAGMPLTNAATINCETASALKSWVNKGLRPAFGADKVAALIVIDSYSCRPRNNVRGAKISEHGRGKAIDIGGLKMADGTVLTVLHDFNRQMRQAYRAGCGIFGTTLGPGSDGFHENHMHFDTARQRGGGSYCR